jgi:hypothetical protein
LARFDEIERRAPLLENPATRVWTRVIDAFDRRDVDDLLAVGSPDGRFEDRRKGLRDVLDSPARRKAVQVMFETVPSGWRLEVEPIAIRGSRLSLTRGRYRDIDHADRPIAVELLHVVELGDDGLMHDTVNFDPDDIDAAFEELEARYLAGEAAPYRDTWSAIAKVCAVINRGELPATPPHLVDVDHRSMTPIGPGDLMAYLRAAFEDTVGNRVYMEAVHRLTGNRAVTTQKATGTSREGLDAEWRMIDVFFVEDGLISRCEIFDESDLDSALARFEELASE